MNLLQELFDEVMDEEFGINSLMFMFISRKLKELGIEITPEQEDRIRNQISEIAGENIALEFDDDQLPSLNEGIIKDGSIVLDFSENDIDAFIEEVKSKFPQIISETIQETANLLAKELKKDAPRMLKKRRRHLRSYSKQIQKTWRKPLDLLEMFIVICLEAGTDFNEELRRDQEADTLFVIDVITRLHARACQISSETLSLLSNGHADGAHARWRSLHEISAISFLISKHDDELAERYILHDGIESYKAALQYQEHCEKLGYEPLVDEEMASLKTRYDHLRDRFGKEYRENYGWASEVLNKKKPSFYDIEKAVGLQHLRPFYKLASHNVHANPKGVFFKLGLFPWDGDLLLAGPSFAGLADPGQGTAISLGQITTILLTLGQPSIDRLVTCQILSDLQNEISSEFINVHNSLEDPRAA